MNGQVKDTKGEAIFRECKDAKQREKRRGTSDSRAAKAGETLTSAERSERRATGFLQRHTLEVSVRSISTTVLTFST